MDYNRIYNFSAGPCALPTQVLEGVRDDLLNHKGSGMSVMEMSHRSKEYDHIIVSCEENFRKVLNIPDTHEIIFYQGGATMQFAAIPMNLLGNGNDKVDYIVSGQWSEKAFKEVQKYSKNANKIFDGKSDKYTNLPTSVKYTEGVNYVHYCANETVNGVEYLNGTYPTGLPEGALLVADMSSNIMSREIDFNVHDIVYAGAQKNLGPAGVTVVIVRKSLLVPEREMAICPTYLSWSVFAKGKSMYNTPACFSIYVMGEYLKYTIEHGGVNYWDDQSKQKSNLLYSAIDDSNGFYTGPVERNCRSRMNVPFQIRAGANPELEKLFLSEAAKQGLSTLSGHRSVGGIRASLYNGMPLSGVEALVQFMKEFQSQHA